MACCGLQVVFLLTFLAASEASVKLPLRNVKQPGEDYYTVTVEVGTPAKSLNLAIDTSSAISWVDYTKMPALLNSTSGQNRGEEMVYQSSTGTAEGVAFMDKFCIKGGSQLCVAKQPYILCDRLQGFSKKKDFHGMLGLGVVSVLDQLTEQNRVPGPSFLEETNASKFAKDFAFGMSLAPGNSYVSFGELKEVIADAPGGPMRGPGVTVPMTKFKDDKIFWSVPMSIAIGKGEKVAAKSLPVKLDSGSSVITAPANAQAYIQNIVQMLEQEQTNEEVGKLLLGMQGEANSYTNLYGALVNGLTKTQQCSLDGKSENLICYCNTTLDPLTFIIDGEGGKSMKIALTSEDLLTQIAKTKSGDPVCQVNIQTGQEPFWTMGTSFLKKAYIVHDATAGKVTFFPTTASAALLSEQAVTPMTGSSVMSISVSMLMAAFLCGSIATFAASRAARLRSSRGAPLLSA